MRLRVLWLSLSFLLCWLLSPSDIAGPRGLEHTHGEAKGTSEARCTEYGQRANGEAAEREWRPAPRSRVAECVGGLGSR